MRCPWHTTLGEPSTSMHIHIQNLNDGHTQLHINYKRWNQDKWKFLGKITPCFHKDCKGQHKLVGSFSCKHNAEMSILKVINNIWMMKWLQTGLKNLTNYTFFQNFHTKMVLLATSLILTKGCWSPICHSLFMQFNYDYQYLFIIFPSSVFYVHNSWKSSHLLNVLSQSPSLTQ